jgi:hypothetical protein
MSTNSGGLLRNIFGTIARGFLLGVGFSAAAGLAYFIAWQAFVSTMSQDIASGAAGVTATFEAVPKEIGLSDVEEQKHDGVMTIIGSARNTGKKPARSVQVRANLFNHGKFVDQYSTYLSGAIAPGESQYFKITCGCKDTPPAEHDSYKVEVVSGF